MFSAGWQSHLCGLNIRVRLFCKVLGAAWLVDVFKSCWYTACCTVKNLGIFHSHSPTVFLDWCLCFSKAPCKHLLSGGDGREAEDISKAALKCYLFTGNLKENCPRNSLHMHNPFNRSEIPNPLEGFILWSWILLFPHSSLACFLLPPLGISKYELPDY